MTEWGLWVLAVVVTAHHEITRGLLRQLSNDLITRPQHSGRYTPPKRKRRR